MTPKLVDGNFKEIYLSCSRGLGLRFAELKPGKVIIMTGGTGVYPFCDLIDLIFKEALMKKKPGIRHKIIESDSILDQ